MSTLQLHEGAKVSPGLAPPSRISGLDALRAVLAVLVVLLHAAMPYMLSPFPGLAWPVHDTRTSGWVDAVGWWADSFVMPAFMLMSGYVACELMLHKGADEFLRHRVRRVLLPLIAAAVVLLPIELYLWLLAWVGQGEIAFVKLKSLKVESPHGDHLWGLSHLWFLEFLFLYSLIAWGGMKLRRTARLSFNAQPQAPAVATLDSDHHEDGPTATRIIALNQPTFGGWALNNPTWLMTLLGGLVAGGIMCFWPRVLIGFQHGWFPHPANFASFGLVFAAGWWLARRQRDEINVTAHCELIAAAGLALFAASLPGLRDFASLRDPNQLPHWSTAVAFGLSGWLSAVGWWAVFVKYVRRLPSAPVRYLAEASFWLYLVHHPLVALMHINLSWLRWPSELKFIATSAASISLSLMMYECLVRRTRLGMFLNGRRHAPAPLASNPTDIATKGARRAA